MPEENLEEELEFPNIIVEPNATGFFGGLEGLSDEEKRQLDKIAQEHYEKPIAYVCEHYSKKHCKGKSKYWCWVKFPVSGKPICLR